MQVKYWPPFSGRPPQKTAIMPRKQLILGIKWPSAQSAVAGVAIK
jgi:hypothetical protein